MLEWSPPRILAVISLAFSAIISSSRTPTFANPYPKQTVRYENIAGGYYEFGKGQLTEKVISENAHSKDRRSPTEDVDKPMIYVPPRKKHGIETPIRPLESEAGGASTSNEDKIASLRSKVDQPEPSNSVGLSTDDNDKISDNLRVSNTESQNKGSESIIGDTEGHKLSDNKPRQSQQTEQTTVRSSEDLDEKGDMGKNKGTVEQQIETQDTHYQHKAQTQDSPQNIDIQATVNNNDISSKTVASANSILTSTQERGTITSDKDSVDSSPKGEGKVNTQVRAKGEYDDQGTSSKSAVLHEVSTNAQKTAENGESQTSSPEPIRDKLGTSGSEIVTTTHGPYERLPYYRDAESKPSSSEPQVGNFQVDDKSADLEINANSAGVKVKAKPASLQVVSRPGSHSASSDTPLARSFYQHYRYPPFHRFHHWLPGFRNAFRPLRRHHLFRPYRIYPRNWFPSRHRYDYEPEDMDAPLHRRHSWYPHRRRGHYHDPYLYGRSRMEAPMRSSRYQYDEPFDRRYRRRFHGTRFHRPPSRHHLYDRYNIPVTNDFAAPNMNVVPDADTMPQLPLSHQMTEQMMIPPYQRQNIVTPVPPPINLFGNPPPSIMNGATFMGRNGMDNFGALSTTNGLGTTNDFAGMTGVNALNGLYGIRGNALDGLDPMAGLNGEMGEGIANLDETHERRQHLETRIPEPAGRPVKKAAIQSVKQGLPKDKHGQRNSFKAHLKHFSSKKSKLALQGWEKILKHHHDLNTNNKTHHRSRRTTKLEEHDELQKRKHNITNMEPQKSKDVKGNRKNAIIIHRPPIIYHPPPEIYHRPSIVVHRAPIMLHRPPIIYHQPPVVVHRPAIIYHQPPIVFHQPPPVVNQPIMHSHDTYVTKPVVYQTNSVLSHAHTYYGVPSNVYSGTIGCHGVHCAFRKGDVPRNGNITDFSKANGTKVSRKEKRNVQSHFDFIASNEGAQEQLVYFSKQKGGRSKRESLSGYYSFLRHKMHPKYTRFSENEIPKKKKDVVVNRPPIIYHPPPEIYHRPDIVVHRPPLVIHRPPIIYHQPPVIVHRPAVVYHQPPIVFHQPPPAVSQPLLYSHDSFMIHPTMYASHHGSVVRDSGHYVGIPNAISNYGHPLFGMQHYPMGKRSLDDKKKNILKHNSYEISKVKYSSVKEKNDSIQKVHGHPKNIISEKAGKKNSVLIARPPIIYHPPPEVYHRPVIVVHRAPIMLHRAPIIYHQPPVVVHRPAIVYHQPPLVFHQPPPVVNQPIIKSHDTWIRRPVVVPYASHISQHSTYVGVPDSFSTHIFGNYHGRSGHGHTFYKSNIPKISRPVKQRATTKNKIEKTSSSTISKKHHNNADLRHSLKRKKTYNEKGGKKNAVIVKRPPVIYHPPPEIYHRPDIIIHRAPVMIHRAAIIYHQPPVIVHRPAVVYHQPPLIFHQPPPVVHQTFLKSHDTWVPKPIVSLYSSRVHHAGHMYHIPHSYYYHGHGPVHYMAYGKSKVPHKSKIAEKNSDRRGIIEKRKHHHEKQDKDDTDMEQNFTGKKKHRTLKLSKVKTERGAKLHSDAKSDGKQHKYIFHREKETTETGAKKNAVIIHRPPIIYHPPPEVYHRPNIVVHRAPIVLYRSPIIYHQPPVVVHRPAIVYHQPPIVFHQPPPVVHQPVMHSHDTWVTKTVAVPYSTHVNHVITYHGVPHEAVYMHGIGAGAFAKSHVPPQKSRRDKVRIHESEPSQTYDGVNEIRGKGSKTVRADAKIRRAIQNQRRPDEENISNERNLYSLGARRIARAIKNTWVPFPEATVSASGDSRPMGAKHRILRAIDDLRSSSEGENTSFMHTSNVGKDEIKTGKRTVLIIRRPPIIYHPPSHVVHRPSIVVHRQPLLVHRQPLIFHRPPILIRRPPIVIHRPPILFRRPPLFVHRPSLVIHRHPFIIHRAPFIIHHHPIIIHRPPIIIHKSPNFLVQHTSAIHHYPMHMVHVHCPGCGFGKSSIFRVRGGPNDRKKKDKYRSHPHSNSEYSKVSPTTRPTPQISNRLKPFVSDHVFKIAGRKINKRETVPGHKKKDVVVNRPPIIYHPPPEVYHRPDIVVHRAPILIHRPPIVYHQPPVVVHRPAVVYHQPPIVFHQPSPAVNQPLLYSHDSFVVHPMAFASHMGSVINDAGHYVGLPHGDINNYPGSLHGPITSTFSPALSRRGKIETLQGYAKSLQGNPSKEKGKQTDGEKKNKVIVARPAMIYHPPPEIYDRPSVIVHRPDLVFHRPSIVYHQPSVVVHRPPVIYRQPPVVFHQPPPKTSQSIMKTMDTYTAQPVFEPHATQVQHWSTYAGTPHFFPEYNNYGWHTNGNMLASHGQSSSGSGSRGWGYGQSFGEMFGRSKVEGATKKNRNGKKTDNNYRKGAEGMTHNKRTAINNSRPSKEQHNRYHKHRHRNSDRDEQTSTITHRGHHRSHVMIINQPPLVYRPPTQVIQPPPVLMSLPPVVYQRPPLVYHQPPTVVNHPALVYDQAPTVFHNPPPTIHDNINTHMHPNYLPLPSYAPTASTKYEYNPQNDYTPVVSGPAFSKSKVDMSHKMETAEDTHTIERNKRALNKKWKNTKDRKTHRGHDIIGSKRQYMDLVVNRPPVVFHSPPDIFEKPPVIIPQEPLIVHQPPVLYHPPPIFVHRQPIIYHQAPLVLRHHTPGFHHHHSHHYHAIGFGYGKSIVSRGHQGFKKKTNSSIKSNSRKGEKKNTVLVPRPPIIYHPPPDIFHKPDVIVHQPDVVIHRPSVVYHQSPVVMHRPSVVYHQPPLMVHQPPPLVHQPVMLAHESYLVHQPPPLVHQPVMLAHESYLAHPTPVDTLMGDPPSYGGAPWDHAFLKSYLAKTGNDKQSSSPSSSSKRNDDRRRRSATTHTSHTVNTSFRADSLGTSNKKNKVVMLRPPMIYHPPAEIYDKPDVIVHRPDYVIHQPSVVYHQPSVVVHRPPVIYKQPPVVFHQPQPMVHQPIIHAHDTYVAHHLLVPYASQVQNTAIYRGTPHVFPGGWNFAWGGSHGFTHGKSNVPEPHQVKHSIRSLRNDIVKREAKLDKQSNKKEGHKKNMVIMRRPPLIYHPPPEIYDRPSIIVHRPDLVIHRPSVVFHQPSIVVHRPSVIYHQPPVVFHQPPPMVHQPILHAHDTYLAHPDFVPYWSHGHHAATYVGAPHSFSGGWGWGWGHGHGDGFGFGHAFGKSKVEKTVGGRVNASSAETKRFTSKQDKAKQPVSYAALRNKTTKGTPGHKKNVVVMHRPPLIYHPPPEIYHRPSVIVHRPDLVIHRPSIVFHQSSVVVHRPSVIYHQPPIVFHQPPPMVHQPLIHAHDTYMAHPFFSPFLSHVEHAGTYVGAPHEFHGGWGWGHGFGHAFGKSKVAQVSKNQMNSENKILNSADIEEKEHGKIRNQRSTEEHEANKLHKTSSPKTSSRSLNTTKRKLYSRESTKHETNRKNLVIMRRPKLIYHPPAEIYDRPDIILHRPELVYHQPSIVYHQPSVVVHRPSITYNQPPVVFHQPSPMVNQPIFHERDEYYAHPYFVPYASHVQHANSYVGAPHAFLGNWGWNPGSDWGYWNTRNIRGSGAWNMFNDNRWASGYGPAQHNFGPAVAKSLIMRKVQSGSRNQNSKASKRTVSSKRGVKQKHGPTHNPSTPVSKRIGATIPQNGQKMGSHVALRKEITEGRPGHKKNMVIMRRPTLVYHPPAEVYHRPDVIVHRPDLVIHRPSVVFHQPSVVVHRPPVIYHQPPVVFHQPPPMVHQAILHSHDTYLAHPDFEPFSSSIHHHGAYVGAPHHFHGGWGWGWGHGFGHSFGKSHVQRLDEEIKKKHTRKKDKIPGQKNKHPERGNTENPAKKNSIVVSRPPIIYHPPPEIYHRPDIVVHRAPIVLRRPPIIYHQPPVVVHRPAVVYHQPPIIFHQPPPAIHQPILHSHDSFVVHPEAHFVPEGSTVSHATNYVGIPSSVMGQNEFSSQFHRSLIEHGKASTQRRTKVPVGSKEIKSTISRIPITHKENTETAITDEAQKKTLRSYIGKMKERNKKRHKINTNFSLTPVTPFNDVHPAGAMIEQHQKLSNIPGKNYDRQNDISKRSTGDRRKKRQAFPMGNIGYHSSLPFTNNNYALKGLQNQALPETKALDNLQDEAAAHPDNADYLTHIIGSSYLNAPLFQSSFATPKQDSPDVHVHVETAKSTIPFSRTRRQIAPVFPVSQMIGPTARFLYSGLENLDPLHSLHAAPQQEIYHVVNPYQAIDHTAQTGLAYNPYPSADEHRPRVSINVNSERSRVPLAKRSVKQRTKRQLWSMSSPFPSRFPAPPSQSYFPYFPYSFVSASPYRPDSMQSYIAGYGGLYSPYGVYRPFRPGGLNARYNALLGYLGAIYGAYSRYPPYSNHHRPKVRVDVQTSRSNIQKAKKKSNNSITSAARSKNPTLLSKNHQGNTTLNKRQSHNYGSLVPLSTEHYTLPLSTTKRKRSTKWSLNTGKSNRLSNNKRNQLENSLYRNEVGNSQRPNNEVLHQSMQRQLVGGNLNAAAFNAEPSVNERSQALSQLNNLALAEQEPISQQDDTAQQDDTVQQDTVQQDDTVQNVNQWQVSQAESVGAPQRLPFQSIVNRLPANGVPFQSSVAPYQAQEQQFQMQRAPFPLSFASFSPTVVPMQLSTSGPLQDLGRDASEQNQGHTSVNVEVTKSSVPKKINSHHAIPVAEHTSHLRGSVTYKKNVGVHKRRQKPNTKRQKITLLHRMSLTQILPQTFKQDGVNIPSSNTIPINNYMGGNGMLVNGFRNKQGQKKRKNNIPSKTVTISTIKRHYKTPRQLGTKKKNESHKRGEKRQFQSLPIYTLKEAVEPTQLMPANTYETNLTPDHHHVSVHVDIAKKSQQWRKRRTHEKLSVKSDRESELKNAQKRQIYGLLYLPQERRMEQFSTDGNRLTDNHLIHHSGDEIANVVPDVVHNVQAKESVSNLSQPVTRISTNVGSAKRNKKSKPEENRGTRSYQNNNLRTEKHQKKADNRRHQTGYKRQFYQTVTEPGNLLLSTGRELPVLEAPSRPQHPRVSVKVEVSKRTSDVTKPNGSFHKDYHATFKRQIGPAYQGNTPTYIEGAPQSHLDQAAANNQAFSVFQNAQQQAETAQAFEGNPLGQLREALPQSQPTRVAQSDQELYEAQNLNSKQLPNFKQTPEFQQLSPLHNSRVSINIEAEKKTLPKQPQHIQSGMTVTKRQMFGTVPLLSPVTQLDVHGRIQPQSKVRSTIVQTNQIHNKNKRQLHGRPPPAVDDHSQTLLMGNANHPFQSDSTVHPYVAMESKPRVNINVQTTKSKIPSSQRSSNTNTKFAKRPFINYLGGKSRMTPQLPARENNNKKPSKEVKRQLQFMPLGAALERRGSPKPLGSILKKPPGNGRFLLNSNFNKPVDVFATDPVATNIPGIPQGKPKFQNSPIMEDQMPLKAAAQPVGFPVPAEMGPNPLFQNSPPDAAPFRQEPLEIGGLPKALSEGIAEPIMAPSPQEVRLLGTDSGGAGLIRRGGLLQVNPLLLTPRVIPISSDLPAHIPFDDHLQDTESLHSQLEASSSPLLPPPLLPLPPPEMTAFHPQQLQEAAATSAGQAPDEERPSVHVNVETSKSRIPNRASYWKHKTSRANRG